jgi:molybdopterin molybdotransferase
VVVERTTPIDDGTAVDIGVEASVGDHVRPAGDDVRVGDAVFASGSVITPAHLGVLASIGVASIAVHPRARVGVLSTGDELVAGDGSLRPGQIRDSNRLTLLALVIQAGCEAVDLGLVRDDEEAISRAIEHDGRDCDVIVTSGGVSMGDFDYVKVVLDRLGEMRWMQVAVKPAKPLAFGTVAHTDSRRRIPVFGLPGNPVSSMVSFELFARPFLRTMMGFIGDGVTRQHVRAVADEPLPRKPDGKTHLVRVVCEWSAEYGHHRVRSAGAQGSHQLAAMAAANALAILPDGPSIDAGDEVTVMLLR